MMMFGWLILLFILFYFWNNRGYDNRYNDQNKGNKDSALEILKERFARGEISFEEYSERKDVLKQ